ncbi:hypothetical protein ACP70R_005745 [Stipagrostis hirtigluma subsp. patula]
MPSPELRREVVRPQLEEVSLRTQEPQLRQSSGEPVLKEARTRAVHHRCQPATANPSNYPPNNI